MKKLPANILAENRAARFHFEILDEFEAGLVLTGVETKSLKTHRAKLTGSFVKIKNGELWLIGLNIPVYRFAKGAAHEKSRDRKILLNAREIKTIQKSLNEKGNTVVALDLHLKKGLIKAKIALARGKKKWDKREVIKKRDVERDLRRSAKIR
ncbi:MAG: SsrA-binding protein SmpB [Candidatus Peribacteraceae bacterium]|nr:SsrA-binding protein SmpB [Candidatus Peribacteraceae bacterium]